jgi:hypothetical protein
MVNSIATAQGKVKERLCEFVMRVSGFQYTTTNQKIIKKNLVLFNRLYPNSFHCKVSTSLYSIFFFVWLILLCQTVTPHSGNYESLKVGHCIALAIFYGPNSVGVLYLDYFWEMPLTVVAFALAIVGFF